MCWWAKTKSIYQEGRLCSTNCITSSPIPIIHSRFNRAQFFLTADIPGAFLQTDQPEDDKVIIRFDGPMMEALAKIDPAIYKEKIQIFCNGNIVLCGKVKKAIYCTVRAAYLFWFGLTRSLKKWGFKVNPYDWCTMNCMFGKDQCTIKCRIAHRSTKTQIHAIYVVQ